MFRRKSAPIEEVRAGWVEPELVEWRKGHDRARSFEDDDQFVEAPQLHHIRKAAAILMPPPPMPPPPMPPPPMPPPRRYGTPVGPRGWLPGTPSSDPHRRGGSEPIGHPAITHWTPRGNHVVHVTYQQQYSRSLDLYASPERSWPHSMQQVDAPAFVPSRKVPVFAGVSYQQHIAHEDPTSHLATRRARRAAIQFAQNSMPTLSSDIGKRSKAVPIVRPSQAQFAGPEEAPEIVRKAGITKKSRLSMDSMIFVPANLDHNSQTPAQMPEKPDASNASDLPQPAEPEPAISSRVGAKVFSESAVLSDDNLKGSESVGLGHEAQVDSLAEALGSLSIKSPSDVHSNMLGVPGAAEGAEKVAYEDSNSQEHQRRC